MTGSVEIPDNNDEQTVPAGASHSRQTSGDYGELRLGSQLGRYIVLKPLGSGGMGIVYAGYDPELDRRVAIKVLRSGRSKDRAVDELVAEARTLAKLADPNVISVFEVQRADQAVFIAMELVEGETLGAWGKRQRSWVERIGVLLGAGRGLAAAHRKEIIHRDFKPANVMLDERGRARVMDFGLAVHRWTSTSGSPDEDGLAVAPSPAREPRLQGTPAYMAPEQFTGSEPTPLSDQYSFCVTAYELLSGARPYGKFKSVLSLATAQRKPPKPLANRKVPARVRAAIMRGLSIAPEDRFPSMQLLLQEFERALRPRRVGWGAVAVGLSVMAAGWAWFAANPNDARCPNVEEKSAELYGDAARHSTELALADYDRAFEAEQRERASTQIDAYVTAWAAGYVDACTATKVRGTQSPRLMDARLACLDSRRRQFDAVVDLLTRESGPNAQLRRTVELVDSLASVEVCADPAAVLSDVEPPSAQVASGVAEARKTIARARSERASGRWNAAQVLATKAVAMAKKTGYRPVRAEALEALGSVQVALHQIESGERTLQDAAWIALAVGDTATALKSTVDLVELRRNIGAVEETLGWADRARELLEDQPNALHEARIEVATSVTHREVGDLAQALEHARRGVEILEATAPHGTAWRARAISELAKVQYRENRLDDALATAKRGLSVRRLHLGSRHPDVAQSYVLLAAIYTEQERFGEAEDLLRRAQVIEREMVGPKSRMLAGMLNNLGAMYRRTGRDEEAREKLTAAIAIWAEHDIEDSQVYAYAELAALAYKLGDVDDARASSDRAWTLITSSPTGRHALRSQVAGQRALIALEGSDLVSAREHLVEALGGTGAPPNSIARAQALLAVVESREGNAKRATELARAAQTELGDEPWSLSDEIAAEARTLATED